MRPLRIPLTPGLPDAGAPGQWLGCDAHGAVYLLRWQADQQCWGALGFDSAVPQERKPWAHLLQLRGKYAGHIIGHVEGPPIAAVAPRPLDHGGISFKPADDAPLWPALLMVLGPSLAACAGLYAAVRLGWLS